jgi:hypothetical protein
VVSEQNASTDHNTLPGIVVSECFLFVIPVILILEQKRPVEAPSNVSKAQVLACYRKKAAATPASVALTDWQ